VATFNELLQDALIRRQVYLSRYSTGLANDIIRLLDATERAVKAELADRLDRIVDKGFDTGPVTTARLKALEKTLKAIRTSGFDDAKKIWTRDLKELAVNEAETLAEHIKDLSPVVLDTILPTAQQLGALVSFKPFEGRVMAEWAAKVERDDLDRMMAVIRRGVVQGEKTPDIMRRVLGSRPLNGVDGVLQFTRHNAMSVTRTAVMHVANEARQAVYQANSDIISGVRPFSRTGRLLMVDQGAGPCRSKAHGSSSHSQSRLQEAGRAGVRRWGDPQRLGT
jgi:hypothetical protein